VHFAWTKVYRNKSPVLRNAGGLGKINLDVEKNARKK